MVQGKHPFPNNNQISMTETIIPLTLTLSPLGRGEK
jgi:hypothetical protein